MTSRESFEAQIRKQFPIASDDLLIGRSSNGRYGSMVTEHAWLAWQAATAAALERAEKACEEEAADIRSEGKGCHTGQYDHMADGAGRCAQAIRALKDAE